MQEQKVQILTQFLTQLWKIADPVSGLNMDVRG